MTDALILTYAAFALLSWGFFIAADDYREIPVTNFIMAVIWPAAWLLLLGYLLGARK